MSVVQNGLMQHGLLRLLVVLLELAVVDLLGRRRRQGTELLLEVLNAPLELVFGGDLVQLGRRHLQAALRKECACE